MISRLSKQERNSLYIALIGIGFFVFFIRFQEVLSNYYDQRNHLSFHIILEFMSILISFMIFFYGMMLYRKTKNQSGYLYSLLFLSIGIFDIFHTITYLGMPFFISESSIAKASWFWVMGRMTEAVMILFILSFKYRRIRHLKAITISLISFVIFACVTIMVIEKQLPILVEEGIGTTPLKNGLEYMVSILHLLAICTVFFQYKKEKKPSELNMLLAFLFLLLGELVFTTYQSIYDLNNFLGHFYKVCGYAFIFRGVLIPLLNEPFIIKEFAEGETKNIKKQMDFILDHMPDGVAIINQEYEIIYVNDGFEKLFGKKREKVIFQNIMDINIQQDEQENKTQKEMIKLAFGGKQIQNYETIIEFNSGKLSIISATLFPNKNYLDQITSVTIILRDITDKKEAEKALIKSEKLSVVGELAAGVAHEIRNPLTTIKGFMKLMEENAKDAEKKYIQLMLEEVDRINLITEEFMTISKPQVKQIKKENVNQIIKEVIQLYQPNLLMNNIVLNRVVDGLLPEIVCEKNQIKQLMINMIKNAVEAMSSGGTITIKTTYNQEFVRIQIKDTGCGIPEELIERLGEPFYTLKEKGTGLGLMVCYRIIEEHKGKIHIDSKEGKGTTFDIQLPIDQNRISLIRN